MIRILLFLVALAFVHAKWEIQIEGKDGWAAKLPCWRLNVFFRKLLGGKPLTGYHYWMLVLFQMFFHLPSMFIVWNTEAELITQGLFIIYFVLEDIMWFIINPHYTWKKFCKKEIDWHKRWIGYMPLTYWVSIPIGVLLVISGYLLYIIK